jgi:hypothetical protein
MMRPGKIWLLVYTILMCRLPGFGQQQFRYTAELDTIATSGFYAITISPQLSTFVKTDLADIRIIDNNKQWAPHILQFSETALLGELFTPFPIVQNIVTDSGKNSLVIENTEAAGIYNLKLFLKNAAVSRTAVLSGSNNRLDWFIIDDQISIGRSYEVLKDEYVQEVNFPLAKYRYLKIIIDNMHNDPLLITKAGFYAKPRNASIVYQDNPTPAFAQKDSSKYSYIEVRQSGNYQFDRVSLEVGGSKFYSRDMQIVLPRISKFGNLIPSQVLGDFKLMSDMPASFELPRTKAPVFFIVIRNADNPPLKIEKVFTQQQPVSLVTYLDKGKRYSLIFGDSLASFPDYDLRIFKDSIRSVHPLNYRNVQAIKKDNGKYTASNNNWLVWASIIFAGAVLSILTYRLTGDLKSRSKIEP